MTDNTQKKDLGPKRHSIKNKEDYSEKMIPIINEIISYNNNIDKMNNAYLNIVKKQSN